jgi:hypothetical protein
MMELRDMMVELRVKLNSPEAMMMHLPIINIINGVASCSATFLIISGDLV